MTYNLTFLSLILALAWAFTYAPAVNGQALSARAPQRFSNGRQVFFSFACPLVLLPSLIKALHRRLTMGFAENGAGPCADAEYSGGFDGAWGSLFNRDALTST